MNVIWDELNSANIANAVRLATGLPSHEWLQVLRADSGLLSSVQDFSLESIRVCGAIEQGIGDEPTDILRYYVWLASGCLTTAFVMTQRNAALRRIESSGNVGTKNQLLHEIRSADAFATVGISHLTTSSRHLSQPPMQSTRTQEGFTLNGFSPWVTGGRYAKWIVVGAVEMDGGEENGNTTDRSELLFAIPTDQAGVHVEQRLELVALTGSSTGPVRFNDVFVPNEQVLHGPIPNVMAGSSGPSGGAGGLQTSALAMGLASQSISFLIDQASRRLELLGTANELQKRWLEMFSELMRLGTGESDQDPGCFRKASNDLALNSTQAALAAAKGAGYAHSHDVGRWCKEALFFLVWSCPQSVVRSHLCTFAS